MTTNSNIDRRATASQWSAAGLTSALYQGAGARGVVCPSRPTFNHGGGLIERMALRPEGLGRKDRRQLQN
ncbi:MAG TPA: hypothetical protein VF297_01200 [Pyrinomonadaceae bacterium]